MSAVTVNMNVSLSGSPLQESMKLQMHPEKCPLLLVGVVDSDQRVVVLSSLLPSGALHQAQPDGVILPPPLRVVGILSPRDASPQKTIDDVMNSEASSAGYHAEDAHESLVILRTRDDEEGDSSAPCWDTAGATTASKKQGRYVVDEEIQVDVVNVDADDDAAWIAKRAQVACRVSVSPEDIGMLEAGKQPWLARVTMPGASGEVRYVFPSEDCKSQHSELTCGDASGALVELFHAARASDDTGVAPVFEFGDSDARPFLDLEALALAAPGMSVRDAVDQMLVPALARAAKACAPLVALGARSATVRHYHPPELTHPIAFVTRTDEGDVDGDDARKRRECAHMLLGLPEDVPRLRQTCAIAIGPTVPADDVDRVGEASATGIDPLTRIVDVHAGLPMPKGTVLCRGPYAYFHYMQDRMDDKGWGCAYRSLQTIVSWFRLNHYTDRSVPSHADIQATLVKLGDKPKSFLGSRQWIGAIELGLFLQSYLDVTYKVITVNRGDEMDQQGRALVRHFEEEGTPVMVGGGVLAYTLLGVRYDESLGKCEYLILDPHYTGGDGDVSFIQKKKWVAWKSIGDAATAGGDLFVKDTFYNLLCPVRPRVV